ncbi:MAG: VTT domain-containing protein [Dehalococcoidia bacterium]
MAIIGSTSPIWPLPGSWAAFVAGGIGLNPFLLGLSAGFGEPIGESTGYMAGYGGHVAVTRMKGYSTVEQGMKRRGSIILFLVSAVPNFVIKATVVCAGALRYPFWKFFVFVWMGKTVKSMFFAYTGYYLFDTLFDVFDRLFGG